MIFLTAARRMAKQIFSYIVSESAKWHSPFLKIYLFIYLFLAVLGLHCCVQVWAFSSCGEWGLLFVVVCGLLIAVASLVAEHRL